MESIVSALTALATRRRQYRHEAQNSRSGQCWRHRSWQRCLMIGFENQVGLSLIDLRDQLTEGTALSIRSRDSRERFSGCGECRDDARRDRGVATDDDLALPARGAGLGGAVMPIAIGPSELGAAASAHAELVLWRHLRDRRAMCWPQTQRQRCRSDLIPRIVAGREFISSSSSMAANADTCYVSACRRCVTRSRQSVWSNDVLAISRCRECSGPSYEAAGLSQAGVQGDLAEMAVRSKREARDAAEIDPPGAERGAASRRCAATRRIIVIGEDVAGGAASEGQRDAYGGVLGVTKGLIGEFGESAGHRHADHRERDHGGGGRRRGHRPAAGRRIDVQRFPRRLLRPDLQPGRQVPLHVRRQGEDADGHPHDDRRRPQRRGAAFAKPVSHLHRGAGPQGRRAVERL